MPDLLVLTSRPGGWDSERMTFQAAITLAVTVLLAAMGYAVKYWNDLRLAQRKDRLDRVNRQLSDLYGPLFALNSAGGRLWDEFRARYRPGPRGFWRELDRPSPSEAEAWRQWMTKVFMPLNRRMMETAIGHADLLREPGAMPAPIVDLFAHVWGYEVIMSRWEAGDFDATAPSDNISVINFPKGTLTPYVSQAYAELKAEQSELLTALALTPASQSGKQQSERHVTS
jgi:hypothetical protein